MMLMPMVGPIVVLFVVFLCPDFRLTLSPLVYFILMFMTVFFYCDVSQMR